MTMGVKDVHSYSNREAAAAAGTRYGCVLDQTAPTT